MKGISLFFMGIASLISGIFSPHQSLNSTQQNSNQQNQPMQSVSGTQKVLTDSDLLTMAGNTYANGELPLGDKKYVTDSPKAGYIYLCHAHSDPNGGGAGTDGPWIHGSTWNYLQKTSVSGKVSWPNGRFSNTVSGDTRILSGNDLPITHTTGSFPIQSTDSAYKFDRNPNSISAQVLHDAISANPTYSDTPYCMDGEVGVILSGVALFDGFDAELRDAAAHELQDSCSGHPQNTGEYHYHSLSPCINDISEKTVIGYALDGFPITGPQIGTNKYLTTDNLDECHGITSEIVMNGKPVTTYHYVMTQDFPYSASCFRSKPIQPSRTNSSSGDSQNGSMNTQGAGQTNLNTHQFQMNPGMNQQPPQQAIIACSGKAHGSSCSFTSSGGNLITGSCQNPPNSSLACIPNR